MKSIKPENVTAIVDTREQLPYLLAPMQVERAKLATGDYSVKGLESLVAVERKTLDDYLACVGRERERFDREMQRILAYPTRALVIESTWQQLQFGGWRGKVTPQAAMGSALGWIAQGVPVVMAGNRSAGDQMVARILFIAARRWWRRIVHFGESVEEKVSAKS